MREDLGAHRPVTLASGLLILLSPRLAVVRVSYSRKHAGSGAQESPKQGG